jgi:hypothetical protein
VKDLKPFLWSSATIGSQICKEPSSSLSRVLEPKRFLQVKEIYSNIVQIIPTID